MNPEIIFPIHKTGGALSMMGSFLILFDVYRRHRRTREIPITSVIVFELSIGDFLSSLVVPFLGTWLVPKESGAYLAAGNTLSCTIQGFIAIGSYTLSVWSNACLAFTYCLIVKCGWGDDDNSKCASKLLLGFSPFLSICWAVVPLFNSAYNFNGSNGCAITGYPRGCLLPESEIECTRGSNAGVLQGIFISLIMIANVVIIISVFALVHSVLIQERRMDAYVAGSAVVRTQTKKAAKQGIWYVVAFLISWGPWYVYAIYSGVTGKGSAVLDIISAFLFPTQGVWNALVYFRPRYLSNRERYRNDSRTTVILRTLGINFPRDLPTFQKSKFTLSQHDNDVEDNIEDENTN